MNKCIIGDKKIAGDKNNSTNQRILQAFIVDFINYQAQLP